MNAMRQIPHDERKRGDIWLWSGRNPIALAIRAITRSRWSHCGWWLDRDTVLEADLWGVGIRDAGWYLDRKDRLITIRLGIEKEKVERAVRAATKLDGRPYDLRLILSLIVCIALGKRHRDEHREWDDAYICSELVAEPLARECAFRFVGRGIDVDATTPQDIWEALRAKEEDDETA